MQSTSVVVQPEASDAPEVPALFKAMYDDLVALYEADGEPEGTMSLIDFEALDGVFVMARIDGTAVGCGGIRRFDAESAEVKRVFVSQSARGQGISRKIMLELESQARALGYRRLVLETGAKQIAAVNLYESMGYTRMSNFSEYADDPMSRCYEKLLA
jgi:putative acetyltransferase